ncbi:hypothetical protein NSA47_02350 [Irregularibacter muris]|uniref:Uncharacterized protein n=1 Tax=Irregularibacter muris TaxID=1796619 RepID=A0AAE3HET0_9FIRM|nr:hypothetical protein [Irregularibacter muris]MCR1897829.1 hypothetical protein [Irregularibacter muris]
MEEIIKKIPWKKVTAPMIPLLLVDGILSRFMIKLHSLNLTHGVTDRFPTDKAFYTLLMGNLFIMFVYLGISAFGHINQEIVNHSRAKLELSPAKEI